MTSAQMAGDGPRVVKSAKKLDSLISDEVAASEAAVQPIKAGPIFAHAQYSDPDTVLALPEPAENLKYVRVAWHYARGIAHIAKGDMDAARSEGAAIQEMRESGSLDGLVERLVPGPDVAKIAEHILAARLAQAEGDLDETVEHFRKAVDLQDNLQYTEPPYWYYPIRQSLGAALLQAGEAVEAESVFRQSLIYYPNNARAFYGLMKAQEAQGNTAAAEASRKLFERAWAGGEIDLAAI
jgi:tetratricopeptide (TPR) repeat protein